MGEGVHFNELKDSKKKKFHGRDSDDSEEYVFTMKNGQIILLQLKVNNVKQMNKLYFVFFFRIIEK